MQALGGHVRGAHADLAEAEAMGAPDEEEVETEQPAGAAEKEQADNGVGIEIREYLAKGYSFEQLTKELHFSDKSVRREMAKVIPPSNHNNELPMVIKEKEIMSPEAVLRYYANGSYEDELELRGMMKLRAAMLMVMELANLQRLTAEADVKRFTPMLEMLKESRSELDAAAARAKDSSMEIAERAAFEVAQGMKGAFSAEMQSLRAALPGSPATPDPMAGMMAETMKPVFSQIIQMMMKPFGMIQQMTPKSQQPASADGTTPNNQPQSSPQVDMPSAVAEHSIDEWEER